MSGRQSEGSAKQVVAACTSDSGVANPPAIIVLGMHRSGTSALTGMLSQLGCSAPSDLMAAAPRNPKGFLESTSITELNDEILDALGSSWFDWLPVDFSAMGAAQQRHLQALAVRRLSEAFGSTDSLIVLKDPRLSRLVPFWVPVFSQTGRSARFVLTHRDPREVVASLDAWEEHEPALGELLWLRYLLDAEASTRGSRRVFTSYGRFLEDWLREVSRIGDGLGVDWPRPPAQAREGVEEFLDARLRRSRQAGEGVDEVSSSPWVRTVYEIRERWASSEEDPSDYAELDEIRDQMNLAAPAFRSAIDSVRMADRDRRRLISEVEGLQGERDEAEKERARAKAEMTAIQERLVAITAERDRLKEALSHIQARRSTHGSDE